MKKKSTEKAKSAKPGMLAKPTKGAKGAGGQLKQGAEAKKVAAPKLAVSSPISSAADESGRFHQRRYVAGQTTKSVTAFANLKRLCETHLAGRYKIEVIDLLKNPALAAGDQIVAVPTLVKNLPPPLKRVIGNLADDQKFLVGLDLKSAP